MISHRQKLILSLSLVMHLVLAGQPAWCQNPHNTSLRPAIPTGKNGSKQTASSLEADIDVFDPKRLTISRPELKGLVSITKGTDPFRLDGRSVRPVSLKDALNLCLERNLAIGIAREDVAAGRWRYRQALSAYLPSIKMSFWYNYLNGALNLPLASPDALRFNNPFIFARAAASYPLYRGGRTVFGALKERNNFRASGHEQKATINDALNQTFELYHKLLLEESVLRIRIQVVKVAQENLALSQARLEAGSATRLDVMQAETQLSQDRQKLIDQQIARRTAAIQLADYLNLPQDIDLRPLELVLHKRSIIDPASDIERLLARALSERPELKTAEQRRLAARKEIVLKAAPLQPDVRFETSVIALGETLGNSKRTVATTGPGGATVTRSLSRQIQPLLVVGLFANWNFDGMGMKDFSQVQVARRETRKALLRQKQEVNAVISQVRRSFLNVLRTDRQIDEALAQLRSSREEINLARLRYENGLGKNIDILRAQSDYTDALIRKTTAIVNYNIAQSNLLRDLGINDVRSLSSGGRIKL